MSSHTASGPAIYSSEAPPSNKELPTMAHTTDLSWGLNRILPNITVVAQSIEI